MMNYWLAIVWCLGFFICLLAGLFDYLRPIGYKEPKESYLQSRKSSARVVLLSPIWFIWILIGVIWMLVKLSQGCYILSAYYVDNARRWRLKYPERQRRFARKYYAKKRAERKEHEDA